MIWTRLRRALRPLSWVAIGLTAGVLIGLLVAPSVLSLLHPNATSAAQGYPQWCSDPNPQSGWSYYATYYRTNGTIVAFEGDSGNGTPIPGSGQAYLIIGTGSYSNQTLIHSMYCYAEQGHSGAFPFHVNLSTNEVVWV
ncbi:MAG: hypothetical protein L3J97_03615 [Thermoplasmata archaeon]|nr:hypothetical protein [Thermoplasmata archaeon]